MIGYRVEQKKVSEDPPRWRIIFHPIPIAAAEPPGRVYPKGSVGGWVRVKGGAC